MGKPRLSHEQHTDIGQRLFVLRNQLLKLHLEVANAYPLSGPESRAGRKLNSALDDIDTARSDLDSALFREHPAKAETSTYYPGATAAAGGN